MTWVVPNWDDRPKPPQDMSAAVPSGVLSPATCDMPMEILQNPNLHEIHDGKFICRACRQKLSEHRSTNSDMAELSRIMSEKEDKKMFQWKNHYTKELVVFQRGGNVSDLRRTLGELLKEGKVDPLQLIAISPMLYPERISSHDCYYLAQSMINALITKNWKEGLVKAHNFLWSHKKGPSFLSANGEKIFDDVVATPYPIMPDKQLAPTIDIQVLACGREDTTGGDRVQVENSKDIPRAFPGMQSASSRHDAYGGATYLPIGQLPSGHWAADASSIEPLLNNINNQLQQCIEAVEQMKLGSFDVGRLRNARQNIREARRYESSNSHSNNYNKRETKSNIKYNKYGPHSLRGGNEQSAE